MDKSEALLKITELKAGIERLKGELKCANDFSNAATVEITRLREKLATAEMYLYSLDPCPRYWGMETDEPCTCSTAARVVKVEAECKRLRAELADARATNGRLNRHAQKLESVIAKKGEVHWYAAQAYDRGFQAGVKDAPRRWEHIAQQHGERNARLKAELAEARFALRIHTGQVESFALSDEEKAMITRALKAAEAAGGE